MHESQSFLEQKDCPLEAVAKDGSALEVRNASAKEIVNWGEFCLVKHGRNYSVRAVYPVREPGVKPHEFAVDVLGFDATPLNTCRSAGGLIAISEVVFSDGTRWKSKWSKGPALSALPISK